MIIPKGTVINLNGFPFEIKDDVAVIGDADTFALATSNDLKVGEVLVEYPKK